MADGSFFPKKTQISTAHYAKEILFKYQIDTLPVNLEYIIEKHGIELVKGNFENRFEGLTLQHNNKSTIIINSDIEYEGRKNFTLAHEIGHSVIPHHNPENKSYNHDTSDYNSNSVHEREANEFASELLMPKKLINSFIQQSEIGFESIKKLSEMCKTSLTASAYRYVSLAPFLAVLVVSDKGNIKNYSISKELYDLKKYYFDDSKILSSQSLAYNYFDKSGNIIKYDKECRIVDSSIWFPDIEDESAKCYEETIGFIDLQQTLSLVWLEVEGDDEF